MSTRPVPLAPAIQVDGLVKRYGDTTALAGLTFTVTAGSVFGLLGPNGAGKTTLIGCLTTMLRPDGGSARITGRDVVADPAGVRERIAVAGQVAALDEALTGRENLVLFGRLLRLPKAQARLRAAELLDSFGLAAAADRRVSSYSGGMRRRLDLAITLVVERPVVLLDEPTTGLDPRSRRVLWQVIRDLRARGITIMLSTQYLEEADQLADEIVVIDHGRLITQGTPSQLKARVGGSVCEVRLADEAARDLAITALGTAPGTVTAGDDTIRVPAGSPETLMNVARCLDLAGIRPLDIALRQPSLDDVFLAVTGPAVPSRRPAATAAAR